MSCVYLRSCFQPQLLLITVQVCLCVRQQNDGEVRSLTLGLYVYLSKKAELIKNNELR